MYRYSYACMIYNYIIYTSASKRLISPSNQPLWGLNHLPRHVSSTTPHTFDVLIMLVWPQISLRDQPKRKQKRQTLGLNRQNNDALKWWYLLAIQRGRGNPSLIEDGSILSHSDFLDCKGITRSLLLWSPPHVSYFTTHNHYLESAMWNNGNMMKISAQKPTLCAFAPSVSGEFNPFQPNW